MLIWGSRISGSPKLFINANNARKLRPNDKSAFFKYIIPEDAARNPTCYNGKIIFPKCLIIAIESWGGVSNVQSNPLILVDDQKARIVGRNTNIPPQIGMSVVQDTPKCNKYSLFI